MYQDTNLRLNTLCKMFPFLKKKIFSVKRNKEFSETRVSKELQEGAVGKHPDMCGLLQYRAVNPLASSPVHTKLGSRHSPSKSNPM